MWKSHREEPATPARVLSPKEVRPVEVAKPMINDRRAEVAHIGRSVLIKGELSGSEDLYLDGEVEGSVELRGHSLTVGPNGRVQANINAKHVIVHGKVDGNVQAERVELKQSAIHVGNVVTQRVVIEEGAYFKGSIDIQKEEKQEPKPAGMAMAAGGTPMMTPSVLQPKR